MRTKIITSAILIIAFILFLILLHPKEKDYYVKQIISPCEIVMQDGKVFKFNDLESFDPNFTEKNKRLAENLGLSEEEAFVIGHLGKYWSETLLGRRKINIIDNDLVYYKFGYKTRFENSPYCIKDGKFTNQKAAADLIARVKRTKYGLLDLDENKFYPITKDNQPEHFIVARRGYKKKVTSKKKHASILQLQNFKLIISDLTTKLKPDRNCSSEICRELLNNINRANKSIDIAIYGYSSVPEIENALKNAQTRGVEIRLVYDLDTKGENIYENTQDLVSIIKNSKSDRLSKEARAIMHNKFYIFDNKTVITGSANLSATDMSGFNSNAVIVLNSAEIAKIYKKEFDQMYSGKFHSDKTSSKNKEGIYFSPQDKGITNGILPLIKNSKQYIYIPAFLITEKKIMEELIIAKNRGVDVKIITDAVNASGKYSKVKDLRAAGVPIKIENYAGKMHSKSIIIDDRYLILGSMNFSYNGENKNDENMIIIENPEAARFYKDFFLYLWTKIPDRWLKGYPRAESPDSIGSCSDGIDNDYDGLIDSADDGCYIKK